MKQENDRPEKIEKIQFYQTENGKEPVREWLRELPKLVKKTIGEDIKTVQHGWPLGMPLVKHMGGKIYELRSTIPNGIARILFIVYDLAIILLHGFIKKTDKTPEKELEIARKRAKNLKEKL